MLFRLVQPVKRPGSRNLQFVQRIPTDLRDRLAGRTLAIPVGDAVVHKTVSAKADSVRLSLRTCDPSDAKVRQAGVAAYLEAYFRSVREDVPVVLTQRQAVALSKALYDGWAEGADRGTERTTSVTFTPEGEVDEISSSGSDVTPEEEAAGFSAAVEHLVRSKAENDPADIERVFGRIVTRRLAAVSIPEVDPRGRLFLLSAFRDAAIDALGLRARHARNDFTPDPQAARFPDWAPPRTQPDARSSDRSATSLRGLVDGWWREAKATGRKPSTHESYRNTMEAFVAFLKHDDPQRVTPEDVIAFKDHRLATINPRSGKPISPKTIKDSDLAGLKTIFGWAVANRKMASNPAEGVTLKVGKAAKLRPNYFTEAEAVAILTAAARIERGSKHPETFAAVRWVPWVEAYTGARVGEIAQLRKEDVQQENGVWVLTITPAAGTVKTNEARTIPLHPHLVELGFPEFVRKARDGHLFVRPDENGEVLRPLQGIKNRLVEFARTIVPDRNVAPNHGWRHRFKTVGLEAGIDHRTLDAIQGQRARTVGESYGEVTLKTMAAAIGKLPRYEVKWRGE